jgi:hypothetical protein
MMLKQIFVGKNPLTTITGALLAGALALQAALSTNPTHWYDWALPVGIAILGRVAGDSNNTK